MIIFDEDRPSDSPFVERVWRCHSEGAAPFLSIAASRCELVVSRFGGCVAKNLGESMDVKAHLPVQLRRLLQTGWR